MIHVLGIVTPGPGACHLGNVRGVPDDFELLEGVSRGAGFPDNAYLEMSKKYPNDIRLEDFVYNTNSLLIVSDRVRQLIEGEGFQHVEFLPVTIVNHKKRKEKAPYFILNCFPLQDCLDVKQSAGEKNPIDPDDFMRLDKIVIDEQRVDQSAAIFRMKGYPGIKVFRRSALQRLLDEGCSGIAMKEIADYNWFEDD
jgi:hypothetical protein